MGGGGAQIERITRTRRKFCQLPIVVQTAAQCVSGETPVCGQLEPAAHTVPAIAGSAGLDLGKLECCWTRRNGMPGRRPLVGWRSLPLKHAGGLVNRPLFLDATVRIFPGHGRPPTSSTVRLQFPQSRAAAIESSRLLFLPDPSSSNSGRNSTRSISSLSIGCPLNSMHSASFHSLPEISLNLFFFAFLCCALPIAAPCSPSP